MSDTDMRLKGVKGFAFEGSALLCVDTDGEIHRMPLPAGPIDFTKYAGLTKFFEVKAEKVCVTHAPSGRLRDIRSDLHVSTAANQAFEPDVDYQQERNLRSLVAKMIQAERKKTKRKPRQQKPEPVQDSKPKEVSDEKPVEKVEPSTEKPNDES